MYVASSTLRVVVVEVKKGGAVVMLSMMPSAVDSAPFSAESDRITNSTLLFKLQYPSRFDSLTTGIHLQRPLFTRHQHSSNLSVNRSD